MLVVVLKACVTEMNETSCSSKELDELGEVGQRPGQPIDPIDDDYVHPVGANVVQKLRQGECSIEPPEKPPSS